MKQAVIQLCRLLIEAVAVLFCLSILFGGGKGTELTSSGKALAEQAERREHSSENGARLLWLSELPAPQAETDDTVYLTGRTYQFLSHIRVRQSPECEWEYAAEAEGFLVEILEVTGEDGKIAGGSWKDGELFFSQSGRYVVELRVTGPYGRYVIQQIAVPVEEA